MAPSGRAGVRALRGLLSGPGGGRRRCCGIARTYVSVDGGGRHDRPSDRADSPPSAIARAIEQMSIAGQSSTLTSGPAVVERASPTGCRARTPRPASRPKQRTTSSRIAIPATITGARVGIEARDLAPLRERKRREPVEQLAQARRGEDVALDPRGVVALEPEVDRRALGRRAGDGDRGRRVRARIRTGTCASRVPRTSRASASSSLGRRRVGVQVALAVADDADLRRDVEARRRARARSSRRRCRSPGTRRRGRAVAPA